MIENQCYYSPCVCIEARDYNSAGDDYAASHRRQVYMDLWICRYAQRNMTMRHAATVAMVMHLRLHFTIMDVYTNAPIIY